ncbi:MAG: helix-turn-helix domain-containing protein [Clostridia bacterium]|nr:helix-turn-helix domain-containing protein [Clostridia bacterium]MBQ9482028.1 helix-turn-helix domain-containing protein [Clostridia bacterium]
MNNDYLIVNKAVLPAFYEMVLKARNLIDNEGMSVSAACKAADISRSTFYKYKDYIFYPSKDLGRKAIFAFRANDERGTLWQILNVLNKHGGSIISVQGTPIKNIAYITITVDMQEFTGAIDDLLSEFRTLKPVKAVSVLAID